MDDRFESDLSFEGRFQVSMQGTEFEAPNEDTQTNNSGYAAVESAMQATQLQSPNKCQNTGDSIQDDTAQPSSNPPNKRRRTKVTDADALTATTIKQNTKMSYSSNYRLSDAGLKELVQLNNVMYTRFKRDCKAYMTDEEFPERLTVIATRPENGSLDTKETDAARRRLYEIAKHFSNDGYGAQYFGRGVPNSGGPVRDKFWPEDPEAIYEMVMPCLKQAVTNHRTKLHTRARKVAVRGTPAAASPSMISPPSTDPYAPATPSGLETSVQVFANIVREQNGEYIRIIPRLLLDSTSIVSFDDVLCQLTAKIGDPAVLGAFPFLASVNIRSCNIKVFGMKGLVDIIDENDWMLALLAAESAEWMDSEMRILLVV